MKKKVLLLSLALVVAISLFAIGCGDKEETPATTAPTTAPDTTAPPATTAPETTAPPTTSAPAETIKLTFSDHNPPENSMAQALVAYADYMMENSGGRVEIDVQLGGALYSNQEIFDGVRTHGVDAGTYVIDTGDGFYYNTLPSLPFMVYDGPPDGTAKFWTLVDEFPELQQEFADLGLFIGAHYMMPPVHIHWHAENFEATHPDDLKGKTLITLEAYVADWFRTLGASTEQPTFPDLFPMIDNRAADGYIQHFNFLGGFDLLDDYKSHTMFGESGVFMMEIGVIWHKATWDSLPEDIKQIALDAREVYVNTAQAKTEVDAEAFFTQVEEENHTMVWLTAEQLKPWQEALAPIYQKWIDGAPDPAVAQQMFDRLLELTK